MRNAMWLAIFQTVFVLEIIMGIHSVYVHFNQVRYTFLLNLFIYDDLYFHKYNMVVCDTSLWKSFKVFGKLRLYELKKIPKPPELFYINRKANLKN